VTLLYELHDQARERGVEGYRKMSKAELEVALGLAEPPGPTGVESEVRGALGVLVLAGANDENALSLETLEALADAAERLAADDDVRQLHRRARKPAHGPMGRRLRHRCSLHQ